MKWIVTYPGKTGTSEAYLWTRLGLIRASPMARKAQATQSDIREWMNGRL